MIVGVQSAKRARAESAEVIRAVDALYDKVIARRIPLEIAEWAVLEVLTMSDIVQGDWNLQARVDAIRGPVGDLARNAGAVLTKAASPKVARPSSTAAFARLFRKEP